MKTIDFSKHDAHFLISSKYSDSCGKEKNYFEDRQYTFGKTFPYGISNQFKKMVQNIHKISLAQLWLDSH